MNYKNLFEGIKFPQYSKYNNEKNYFKIISENSFEEKSFVGKKVLINQFEAKILPDRNFIVDLVFDFSDFAVAISESEYLLI
jgi:hypothetical protein